MPTRPGPSVTLLVTTLAKIKLISTSSGGKMYGFMVVNQTINSADVYKSSR